MSAAYRLFILPLCVLSGVAGSVLPAADSGAGDPAVAVERPPDLADQPVAADGTEGATPDTLVTEAHGIDGLELERRARDHLRQGRFELAEAGFVAALELTPAGSPAADRLADLRLVARSLGHLATGGVVEARAACAGIGSDLLRRDLNQVLDRAVRRVRSR